MSAGKINEWHEAHRMPAHPTRVQRLGWHIAHMQVCGCRAPSAKLQSEIEAYMRVAAPDTSSA